MSMRSTDPSDEIRWSLHKPKLLTATSEPHKIYMNLFVPQLRSNLPLKTTSNAVITFLGHQLYSCSW